MTPVLPSAKKSNTGIQAPAQQDVLARPVAILEVGVELRQADLVHFARPEHTRLLELVDPILTLDEDLVAVTGRFLEVAVEDVLDPGAVVQEAQQRVPVGFGVAHRVARDHDVESRPLAGEPVAAAPPLFDDRRRIAQVEDSPAPPALFIEREPHLVARVAQEQLDHRVERRLVVDEADLEQQADAPRHAHEPAGRPVDPGRASVPTCSSACRYASGVSTSIQEQSLGIGTPSIASSSIRLRTDSLMLSRPAAMLRSIATSIRSSIRNTPQSTAW